MTVRLPLGLLLFTMLFLVGCSGPAPAPPANPPPLPAPSPAELPLRFKDHNLVFVSFDALQARHVGALGYSRDLTPGLDRMAAEGTLFTNTTSVASWTVPASMTWFTGVYPSEHRMVNKFAVYNAREQRPAKLQELSPNLVTLAEIFRQNGYATGGFTGNAGVSGGFGYEAGFDVYFYEPGKFGSFDLSIPKALEWLQTAKDRKFFLFLHGYDCHGQNVPAHGFDQRFVEKDYDGRYTGSELEQEILREEGLENGKLTLRDADVRFWRAIYDEKIARTDEKFRHFLAKFEKLGVAGKTLFILTSDHGTEFYEHRRLDHGFTLYQEQLHVPLVIKLPGRRSAAKVTDRVSSIDVLPTIVDLLDLELAEPVRRQLRGTSLVPAMRGEPARRDLFSETDYREYTFQRSIIDASGWKLIYILEKKTRELYDLNTDPSETKNLAAADAARADELERKLFAHFKSLGHDLTVRDWKVGLNPVYASQAK